MGVELDQITDPAEKQAHEVVMQHYAQELQRKAKQTYPKIFANYDDIQVYYKWYSTGQTSLTNFVAIRDSRDDTIHLGPSNNSLDTLLGIHTKNSHIYKPMSIQDISKHLQEGKIIQYVTYPILDPIYKSVDTYNEKSGSIGLYVTDNYEQIIRDFGGYKGHMARLYNQKLNASIAGPWRLPNGAEKRQPKVARGVKNQHGTVEKWEG
jgi:hypothetical protein